MKYKLGIPKAEQAENNNAHTNTSISAQFQTAQGQTAQGNRGTDKEERNIRIKNNKKKEAEEDKISSANHDCTMINHDTVKNPSNSYYNPHLTHITPSAVITYAKSIGYDMTAYSAEEFIDYGAIRGWITEKNQQLITDWRGLVKLWKESNYYDVYRGNAPDREHAEVIKEVDITNTIPASASLENSEWTVVGLENI